MRGGGAKKLSVFRATEGEIDRLDRFELIAELASGGMATVYLARLSGAGGFQRLVAIKRPHPHLAREDEFTQMFLDEARLAARLHHPHVVSILEIGESDGYYLVMEYIEGDTLAKLMARAIKADKPLPPEIALRIGLDTLSGLHAAHELLDDEGRSLEIVHRDVSPQNILVGVDGSARITDFGVARATSRLTTTRSGQLKGKMAYMAPEQARGKSCDRRADIFAMGIVLWETLASKRLFKGEADAETLTRLLLEPIPALRAVNPEVSPQVEAVVMKALEREPQDRFATCADMTEALEDAARATGFFAEHRDVAEYLQTLIGSEISQQREAVRAWLVREPSRPGDGRTETTPHRKRVPMASELSDATKIVVMETGEETKSASGVGSSARRAVPPEVALTLVGTIAASEIPAPLRSGAEGMSRARQTWLLAGVAVLVAAGGFALARAGAVPTTVAAPVASGPVSAAAGLAPATTAAVHTTETATTATATHAATESAPPVAAPAPSASSAPSAPSGAHTAPSRPGGGKPGPAPARSATRSPPVAVTPSASASQPSAPAGAGSAPALPPDMSYNPYR